MSSRRNNILLDLASARPLIRVLDRIIAVCAIVLLSTIVAFAVPLPEARPDPDVAEMDIPEIRPTEQKTPEEKIVPETEETDSQIGNSQAPGPVQESQQPTGPVQDGNTAEDSDKSPDSQESPKTNLASVPVLRPDHPDDPPEPALIMLPELRPADPPPPSAVVSSDDYFTLRRILVLLKEDSIVAAQTLSQTLKDPLSKTVAEWLFIRSPSLRMDSERLRVFIDAHPHWPSQNLFRKRVEAAFLIIPPVPQTVLEYFANAKPLSGLGNTVLAYALLKTGENQQASELIRTAWSQHLFSRSTERLILRRFSDVLTEEDHLNRLRYLLYRKKIAAAGRAAAYVGPYGKSLIRAHNAISARSRRARQAYVRAPAILKQDPLIILRQAQLLRRGKKYVEAAALLISSTPNNLDQINAHGWWPERSYLVRRMLTATRPDLAYKLAAQHYVTDNKLFAEAEFLAGWIALRYLYDADLAYFHFRTLRKSVTQPLSIARAEYWLGRAEDMRANHTSAIIRYANAEKYPYTFYGQMAMTALGRTDLTIPPLASPTSEERERFNARDLTQAAILFYELGENRQSRRFLVQNARLSESETGAILSAELAESHGQSDTAFWIGKAAFLRDHLVYQAAHTLTGLPEDYDQLSGLEPALIYAVSRQESAFDIAAISHAGARGLMQLMPPTAKEVADQLQIDYSLARLTRDPSYNVTLGATYLEGLIARFNGSYIMAIPGYNAGGGRVNRWTRDFGDPRDPLIDPVDWIERMPLNEPRNYVQRVLANLQIYRAILSGGSHSLDLLADLQRGVRNTP